MMLKTFSVMLATVVVAISGASIKHCKDCVLLTDCPGAVYLTRYRKTRSTESLIRSALCSSKVVDRIPEVCCSEFPLAPSEIDNHPNLSLLPNDCGVIQGDRIVGGETANLFEFPWMALISYITNEGLGFQCGGTLINSRYVLTAAHCVMHKKIAGVRLGDYNYLAKEECNSDNCPIQDVVVKDQIIHPSYNSFNQRNDIALIHLNNSAKIQYKNIRPICLPVTQELRMHSLVNATVAGWGLTEIGTLSSTLRKVEVPVQDCREYYGEDYVDKTKNILCAGEVNKDSCKGDSGGPLMLEAQYNGSYKYIQYGVVSNGPTKCGSDYPGVYTDVSWFMKWILDNIEP